MARHYCYGRTLITKYGEKIYRATSLPERFNQEIRARDRMGSVLTIHNLLVLLQLRCVLT